MKSKNILSCMVHPLGTDQIAELKEKFGDVKIETLGSLSPELFEQLKNCPGDEKGLYNLAQELREVIQKEEPEATVLPIGSPAFMFAFANNSEDLGSMLFAHSVRESVETTLPDGSVKKINVFRHIRFLILDTHFDRDYM